MHNYFHLDPRFVYADLWIVVYFLIIVLLYLALQYFCSANWLETLNRFLFVPICMIVSILFASRILIVGVPRVAAYGTPAFDAVVFAIDCLAVLFCIVAVGLSWSGQRLFFNLLSRVWRLATPVVAMVGTVLLFNTAWAAVALGMNPLTNATADAAISDAQSATPNAVERDRKVVFLLFDALDARYVYDGVKNSKSVMPHLQDMLGSSLDFRNVKTVEAYTQRSVGSILSGDKVEEFEFRNRALMVRVRGSDMKPLRTTEHLFKRLQRNGLHSGVVSDIFVDGETALPYCRMFAENLRKCWNFERWVIPGDRASDGLWYLPLKLASILLPNLTLSHWDKLIGERREGYQATVDAVAAAIHDDGLDFVYAHFLLPHAPHYFDASTNTFTPEPDKLPDDEGYIHSLGLVDRTLARVRAELDRLGDDADYLLVVTADHGWAGYTGVPVVAMINGGMSAKPIDREHDWRILKRIVEAYLVDGADTYDDLAAAALGP